MAFTFRKYYYKYSKCIVITVLLTFFIHIYIALSLFPSLNDNLMKKNGYVSTARQVLGEVSARKNSIGYSDDEDLSSNNKNHNKLLTYLRLEELDFKPSCEIKSREAISAIHRAKTQKCKQQIVNKTCLIQSGNFYPVKLPNGCLRVQTTYGKYLGCYADEKKLRLLTGFYGNYANTNSPTACLDICIQAGFLFAGVQYASECFCGENQPQTSSAVADHLCDMKCPGNVTKYCGGYFTMNIYETGLSMQRSTHIKKIEIWPAGSPDINPIEHAWDAHKRGVWNRQPVPQTVPELREVATQEQDRLPQEMLVIDRYQLSITAVMKDKSKTRICLINRPNRKGHEKAAAPYISVTILNEWHNADVLLVQLHTKVCWSEFTPKVPKTTGMKKEPIQIVFLLTLNGRALRQVHRLINALYRSNHYFYIHVDKSQLLTPPHQLNTLNLKRNTERS